MTSEEIFKRLRPYMNESERNVVEAMLARHARNDVLPSDLLVSEAIAKAATNRAANKMAQKIEEINDMLDAEIQGRH